jgi:hypothetical protein
MGSSREGVSTLTATARDTDALTYSSLEISVNSVFRLIPTNFTPTSAMSAMNATIKPYSTIVAPSSSSVIVAIHACKKLIIFTIVLLLRLIPPPDATG